MSKEQTEQQNAEEQSLRRAEELYHKISGEKFEIGERREWMLPMRDGVKLRTIIQFPGKPLESTFTERKTYPVVVQRSCYPHTEQLLELHAREYSKRGFVFVYQWCRGTGGSEGEWVPNINDRKDGLDTLEYLSAQPYTDCIG